MKITNLASLMGLFCTCLSVIALSINCLADAEAGRVFKVGDELGWQVPVGNISSAVYSQWAQRNRFRVGDSLLFFYKNDSVIQVEKWGLFHCSINNSIVSFSNGRSTFNLDKPGPFYFISGFLNHCKKGQRLIIEVMALHRHPRSHHSPPSMATAPDQPLQAPSTQPTSGTSVSVRLVSVLVVLLPILVALL